MRDLTVTIGRQNGSGGREVGKVLADRLGVECYDRTVIEKTADRMGIPVEDAERMEERARTGSNLFFGGIPTANPMFAVQSDVIRSLASKGQCVFVGRCADYVLPVAGMSSMYSSRPRCLTESEDLRRGTGYRRRTPMPV